MSKRLDLRLSGSGGQGVILATIILAEAAILANKQAVQSQAYGPEARGGMCKAETIISDDRIWFTKVQTPNFLLALTQEALEKFGYDLTDDAIVMVDSSLNVPDDLPVKRVYALPILDTAREKVGRAMTANIVAVGAINAVLHIVPEEEMLRAVLMHVPKGTEELNTKALKAGVALLD